MDPEPLVQALILAVVLAHFTEALIKPLVTITNLLLEGQRAEARAETIRQWPLYLTGAIGAAIAWHADLNLLTMLSPPSLGHVLTAIGIGLGPSFIHSLIEKLRVVRPSTA